MIFYYYINNNLEKIQNINDDLDWLIINHFCKLISNDKNQVIAISFLVCQN